MHVNAVSAAEQKPNPNDGRKRLRDQRRKGCARHAQRRRAELAENQHGIEAEVDRDRGGDNVERRPHLAHAAHQRLHHRVHEQERQRQEHDAQERQGVAIYIGRNPHQMQKPRRNRKPNRAERHGKHHDGHKRLGRDTIDHHVIAGAGVLRDERRARDGETHAGRDQDKHHRHGNRNRRHRCGAQPAHPERVDQLIGDLQDVRAHDRRREQEQRARNRALEKARIERRTPGRFG